MYKNGCGLIGFCHLLLTMPLQDCDVVIALWLQDNSFLLFYDKDIM